MESFLWTNWNIDVWDNRIWFVPFEGYALCGFNLISEKLDKIIFQNFIQDLMAAFVVKVWNGKIVVVPDRDNVIRIIGENEEKHYQLEDNRMLEKYDCAEEYNEDLYLFPRDEKNIVRLYKKNIEYIPCIINGFVALVSYNHKIWGVNRSNKVYSYDIESKKIYSHEIKDLKETDGIIWIGLFEAGCVLTTTEGYVIFADQFDFENVCILGKAPDKDYFRNGIAYNHRLILFPFNDATSIYYYDGIQKIMGFNKISDDCSFGWRYDAFGVPIKYMDCIFIMSPKHEALLKLDGWGNLLKKYYISIDSDNPVKKEIISYGFKKNQLFYENKAFWSLDTFINCVINGE